MVRKLVAYPRYDGHWSAMPFQRSSKSLSGTLISRTRSVIAMAKTPSLNASIRPVPSDRTPPLDDGHTVLRARIAHAATITRSG